MFNNLNLKQKNTLVAKSHLKKNILVFVFLGILLWNQSLKEIRATTDNPRDRTA